MPTLLRPSKAGTWGSEAGCTGSINMQMMFPQTSNPAAAEGVGSHEVAVDLFKYMVTCGNDKCTAHRNATVGTILENKAICSDEMWDCAFIYAQDVASIMRKTHVFGGPNLAVEQHLKIPQVHSECAGTPDCWLYDSRERVLYIWDYKFGRVRVDAFKNWQIMCYLAGVIPLLGVGPADAIDVHIRLVQPRVPRSGGAVDEWVTTSTGLQKYFSTLKKNAIDALSPDALCHSGNHCRYCNARHACQAAKHSAMEGITYASSPMPENITPEGLGTELLILERAHEAIEYRETGVRQQIEALIRRGERVAGYALEPGTGSLKWAHDHTSILELGTQFGHDLQKHDCAMTPRQAIKAGMPEAIVQMYSERIHGKTKLKRDDESQIRKFFK